MRIECVRKWRFPTTRTPAIHLALTRHMAGVRAFCSAECDCRSRRAQCRALARHPRHGSSARSWQNSHTPCARGASNRLARRDSRDGLLLSAVGMAGSTSLLRRGLPRRPKAPSDSAQRLYKREGGSTRGPLRSAAQLRAADIDGGRSQQAAKTEALGRSARITQEGRALSPREQRGRGAMARASTRTCRARSTPAPTACSMGISASTP